MLFLFKKIYLLEKQNLYLLCFHYLVYFFTFLHGLIWQHEVEACNFYTYFQSACEMSGEGARTNFSMFRWR